MVSLNVDGLISGLDTTSVISQLMTLERQPQQRLVARRDETNKVADLYRQLNTRFNAIESAAENLSSAADWRLSTVTSSHPTLATATVASGAPAGGIAFRVTSLAAAHTVIATSTAADPTTAGTYAAGITVGGSSIADVGTGSLVDVAAAINLASTTVSASVVRTGDATYRLQLTSRATGAAAAFTTGGGLDTTVVTQSADASVTVGETNPYTVTSSTNTVTDLLGGVTLQLKAADPATVVRVDVARDAAGLADRVQSLVTAVNDATAIVRTNARFDAATKKAGAFLADQVAGRLATSLVTNGTAGATGVSVDRFGVLTFDRTRFLAAYAADPSGVEAAFTAGAATTADDGLAERLRVIAEQATASGTGQISAAIESRTSTARSLDAQIANWDNRLALREKALKRQFSALETALGQAQTKSSWLAGQLGGMSS
jgi:flagellar hook-associated protein 2